MINPPALPPSFLYRCKLDGGGGLGTRVCLLNINSLSLPLGFGGVVCVFVILMLGSCFVMRIVLRTDITAFLFCLLLMAKVLLRQTKHVSLSTYVSLNVSAYVSLLAYLATSA